MQPSKKFVIKRSRRRPIQADFALQNLIPLREIGIKLTLTPLLKLWKSIPHCEAFSRKRFF
jgi:hypothetical protein